MQVAACRVNALQALEVMISTGINLDAMSGCDLTPLMEATQVLLHPRCGGCRLLITGCGCASQFSRHGAMELLLKHGANPNIESVSTSSTAIIQAIKIKNLESVKLLLRYGANPCMVPPSAAPSVAHAASHAVARRKLRMATRLS